MIRGRPRAAAGAAAFFVLGCEATLTSVGSWTPAPNGIYLEAESGARTGCFVVGTDAAASGGRYLEAQSGITADDAPGTDRVTYELTVSTAGTYSIWGRIRSPTTATNRIWVQVDGGAWFKWRITVGDVWYWSPFHDDMDYFTPLTFALSAGTHALVLANCVDGVELDRLYYTTGSETPPGNDTPCAPPNSIELQGVCHPSCGSQGRTTCGADMCGGRVVLPSYDCEICCLVP